MLEMHAQEFVSICRNLIKKHPQQMLEKYIYIEPAQLRRMLDKYKYETSDNKLRVWRNLGWLLCEPDRLTRNVNVDGKQKRMAALSLPAYRQLKELIPDREAGESQQNAQQN